MLTPITVTLRQARRLWQRHSLPECTGRRVAFVRYTADLTDPDCPSFVVGAIDRREVVLGWTQRQLVWGAGVMDLPRDPLTLDTLKHLTEVVSFGRDPVLCTRGTNFSVEPSPMIRKESTSSWDA